MDDRSTTAPSPQEVGHATHADHHQRPRGDGSARDGPAAGVAAGKSATKLSCTIALFAQGAPSPSAIHLGRSTCPQPFGKGLHYDEYTVTPTAPGTGSVAGTFKNYYDRGTASGTFALTFAASSPTDITYTGTVIYAGGTGAFRHVEGGGTIQCTTTDGGAHKACSVHSTLTGI